MPIPETLTLCTNKKCRAQNDIQPAIGGGFACGACGQPIFVRAAAPRKEIQK